VEQTRRQKIDGLEATLSLLHRREMRLLAILSSTLTSREYREGVHLDLEALLLETRELEEQLSKLEAEH
jgi:hypothetical protein